MITNQNQTTKNKNKKQQQQQNSNADNKQAMIEINFLAEASKLYGVNATIIIIVFLFYCIVLYCIVLYKATNLMVLTLKAIIT